MKKLLHSCFMLRFTQYIFSVILFLFLFSCKSNNNKVVEKYPDGSIKSEKYYIKKDTEKILVKEVKYYSNHQKQLQGEYKDKKRNGGWVYYYSNGNKWSEGSFLDGLDNGLRTTYFENGQKRYEGVYNKGKEIGIWKFWDEKGTLVKTVNYDTVKTTTKTLGSRMI